MSRESRLPDRGSTRARPARRRSRAGALAALPLLLGTGLLGLGTSAGAAVAARHDSLSHHSQSATPAPANFMPPLPRGVRYNPASTRLPHLVASPPAKDLPFADRQVTAHPSAAALAADRSNSKALTTTTAPPTESDLYGISCVSTTFCMAVGQTEDYGTDNDYATEWNGKSWTNETLPQVTEDGDVEYQILDSVSCWSDKGCMAVGFSETDFYSPDVFAELWNGKKWTIKTAAVGEDYSELEAISCLSADFCEAVGAVDDDDALGIEWNGTAWSVQSFPGAPTGDLELDGVSCASETDCVAAGEHDDQALLFLYAGSTWNEFAADDVGDSNYLYSVSCPTITTCLAVGSQYTDVDALETLYNLISVSGSSASVVGGGGARNPFSSENELTSVSCSSPSSCVAVGQGSPDASEVTDTLAESYDGSSWTTLKTSSPGSSPEDRLTAVSCSIGTSCVTVGNEWSAQTSWFTEPLADSLSGSKVTALSVPLEKDVAGWIYGIACPSSSFCIAAGYYYSDDNELPMVQLWNGKSWRLVAAPIPSGFGTYLGGVTCTSTSFCMLAGSVLLGHDDQSEPALFTYNGSSITYRPAPANLYDTDDSYLYEVSCTSPDHCIAIGSSDDSPLSAVWNGSSVAVEPMPQVDDYYAYPDGLSCTSSSHCFSIIDNDIDDDTISTIVEWNGSSWSITDPAVSVGGQTLEIELFGLACTSATHCLAVGEGYLAGIWQEVTATYNGHHWSATSVAGPAGNDGAWFEDVVCSSSTECTAIGGAYRSPTDFEYPTAQTLKGTKWSTSTYINNVSGGVYALACSSSSRCFASGASWPQQYNADPLILADNSGKWTTSLSGP